MYSNTVFQEILKALPRSTFEKYVKQSQSDKYSKGFRCWDQYIAMIYGQLSGCNSLRQIEASFNEQLPSHYHLGTRSIKRSTLADANSKPRTELYASLCDYLLSTSHRCLRKSMKPLLYMMDSSCIHLKGNHFGRWADAYRNNLTQGIKLHLMYEAHHQVPTEIILTGSQASDCKIGKQLTMDSGQTYVFDKGYNDLNWWYQIHQANSYFVTRFKKNAAIKPSKALVNSNNSDAILSDEEVYFTRDINGKTQPNHYYGTAVRRITVHRTDKDTPLILVTNDFNRSADEIAALYKKRWDIELFFKWVKQNLKLKKFVGYSENAVKTQIYIAIIAYLLVHIHKQANAKKTSLMLHLNVIKQQLFQRPFTEYYIAKQRRLQYDELLSKQTLLHFENYLGQ